MNEVQHDEHVQYYYHVWHGVMTKILYGQTYIKYRRLSNGTVIGQPIDPNTIHVHQVWSV